MTVTLSRMIMMMILECSHVRGFGGCFDVSVMRRFRF